MSRALQLSEQGKPFEGIQVLMLRESDYAADGRVRKQAATLSRLGARITMVGVGESAPGDLVEAGYDVRVAPQHEVALRAPRWGRSDVFWPVRVMVNLLWTPVALKREERKRREAVYHCGPVLVEAAEGVRPHIVHSYNIYTLEAAVEIARATGARIIYDCRDLFGDAEFVDSETREKIHAAEKRLLGKVAAVLVISEPMGDVLASRHKGVHPVAIYNGPAKVVDAASPASNPVKLFFQGSFSADRNIEALVRSMEYLRAHATLSLQGFGGIHDYLVALVDELSLGDVVEFVPACAPLEVVDCASRYDVGVVCHVGSDLNMDIAAPNKLMDYLGAGLAVAGSDLPGIRSVIADTGAGILIDPTDEHSIAASLLPLVSDPDAVSAMKARAVELARTYEWPVQAERLVEVYEKVLTGKGRGFDV